MLKGATVVSIEDEILRGHHTTGHFTGSPRDIYPCVKSGHLGFVLVDAQAPGLQAPDSVGLARKSQAEGFACGGKGGRGPWR